MAKKISKDSLINVELEKLQAKVDQFQSYLELNAIVAQVTRGNDILLSEDDQDKLHKEILIQIKIQDALFQWLPLLEKLKEDKATKDVDLRGGAQSNGLFDQSRKK